MRNRIAAILCAAFLSVVAVSVPAQESSGGQETVENLNGQLIDLQNKEAELKIRLEQLDYDLKPENIERHFNGYGSTRPEELRESRRRQLQIEKDRLGVLQGQLAAARTRLEIAITQAQARSFQQSALGASSLSTDRKSPFLTGGRILIGSAFLLLVVGSLVLRVIIRERQHY